MFPATETTSQPQCREHKRLFSLIQQGGHLGSEALAAARYPSAEGLTPTHSPDSG